MLARPTTQEKKGGLGYWAERVLQECDRASLDFAADPVHDLRVAIRRCRSMADGFLSIDPDPGWKQMKRAAKPLFSALGELRDSQVMHEWVSKLSEDSDPVRQVLLQNLVQRESTLRIAAEQALQTFDRKQWSSLNSRLARRTGKVPMERLVFQHLALERWIEAHDLHKDALRNRSQVAYHQLRIGIKRFRYTLENFLPQRHEKWARDLRNLQDALGEVHDLDVLRGTVRAHTELTATDRLRWLTRIGTERQQRLDLYRQKMVGRNSLWHLWRSDLPDGELLQQAATEKLRTWASYLDPDPAHTELVARLALQLYDALCVQGDIGLQPECRSILEAAAILHEIGDSKSEHGHRKRTYRMISKLAPPIGWTAEQLHCSALVARLHRGKLPEFDDSSFVGLSPRRRVRVMTLGGILRLANAFDWNHDRTITGISVEKRDSMIIVHSEGLEAISPLAERLARERYLLETAYGKPFLIVPSAVKPTALAPKRERARAAAVPER